MEKDSNIQPMQSDFEQIKKVTEKGKEYWSARELATALGYSTWQKFNRVLNKALKVAQERGMDMGEHFNQVVDMVKLWESRVEVIWREIYNSGEQQENATIRIIKIVQTKGELQKRQLFENFQ
jgi:prophage antirepressor-like protein